MWTDFKILNWSVQESDRFWSSVDFKFTILSDNKKSLSGQWLKVLINLNVWMGLCVIVLDW
jgi:hypothetical protein